MQVGSGTRTPDTPCGGCSHARGHQSRLAPSSLPPSGTVGGTARKPVGPPTSLLPAGQPPLLRGEGGVPAAPAPPWHPPRVCRRRPRLPGRAGLCRCRTPRSEFKYGGEGRSGGYGMETEFLAGVVLRKQCSGWRRGAAGRRGRARGQRPFHPSSRGFRGEAAPLPMETAPAALMRTRPLSRCPRCPPPSPASCSLK